MRGKTLQTVPFKGISTVLWVHQKLPQSTVSQAFPSNKSYESKASYNRTPATVLWVPLIVYINTGNHENHIFETAPFQDTANSSTSGKQREPQDANFRNYPLIETKPFSALRRVASVYAISSQTLANLERFFG